MWFQDLSNYSYSCDHEIDGVLNVGWLDGDHMFSKGSNNPEFLVALEKLVAREDVRLTRGIHGCHFCNDSDIFEVVLGKKELLGVAEVWVPDSQDHSIVYAAPSMILHYCREHSYSPPDDFTRSVLCFDFESEWMGSNCYLSKITQKS